MYLCVLMKQPNVIKYILNSEDARSYEKRLSESCKRLQEFYQFIDNHDGIHRLDLIVQMPRRLSLFIARSAMVWCIAPYLMIFRPLLLLNRQPEALYISFILLIPFCILGGIIGISQAGCAWWVRDYLIRRAIISSASSLLRNAPETRMIQQKLLALIY